MINEKKCTIMPLVPTSSQVRFSAEPTVLGMSESQIIQLRPGLALVIHETNSNSPPKTDFDVDTGVVQFGFTWSGHNRCTYYNGKLRNKSHSMGPGSNGIFHLPKTTGVLEQPKDQAMCVVGILTTPDLLRSYVGDMVSSIPRRLQKILDGDPDSQLAWFGVNSPAKTSAISNILHHPYPEFLRTLYLESRVLELVAAQLGEFVADERGIQLGPSLLSSDDVERIQTARKLLLVDLEHPPSLSELASGIGFSTKKLTTGFRQVFGLSVYSYYREYRLQVAREILESGNANVTEAAFTVGYQSLSHFSQAFRQRFGLNPKDYLSNQRWIIRFAQRSLQVSPNLRLGPDHSAECSLASRRVSGRG